MCDYSNENFQKHFPVVLFVVLYNVVLTSESVYAIPMCGNSNKSY